MHLFRLTSRIGTRLEIYVPNLAALEYAPEGGTYVYMSGVTDPFHVVDPIHEIVEGLYAEAAEMEASDARQQ